MIQFVLHQQFTVDGTAGSSYATCMGAFAVHSWNTGTESFAVYSVLVIAEQYLTTARVKLW